MTRNIPDLFAHAAAKLEDLHAIAIEGRRADNAPDMHAALACHLRSGLVALEDALQDIATTLNGRGR